MNLSETKFAGGVPVPYGFGGTPVRTRGFGALHFGGGGVAVGPGPYNPITPGNYFQPWRYNVDYPLFQGNTEFQSYLRSTLRSAGAKYKGFGDAFSDFLNATGPPPAPTFGSTLGKTSGEVLTLVVLLAAVFFLFRDKL